MAALAIMGESRGSLTQSSFGSLTQSSFGSLTQSRFAPYPE